MYLIHVFQFNVQAVNWVKVQNIRSRSNPKDACKRKDPRTYDHPQARTNRARPELGLLSQHINVASHINLDISLISNINGAKTPLLERACIF